MPHYDYSFIIDFPFSIQAIVYVGTNSSHFGKFVFYATVYIGRPLPGRIEGRMFLMSRNESITIRFMIQLNCITFLVVEYYSKVVNNWDACTKVIRRTVIF